MVFINIWISFHCYNFSFFPFTYLIAFIKLFYFIYRNDNISI